MMPPRKPSVVPSGTGWGAQLEPCHPSHVVWLSPAEVSRLFQSISIRKKSRALAGGFLGISRLKLLQQISKLWEQPCNVSSQLGRASSAVFKPLSVSLHLSAKPGGC